MPAPSSMADLSTTASANYPAGSDYPSSLDDSVRALSACVKSNVSKGSDIASASSITIPANGGYFVVTGTTAITAIATTNAWNGREVTLEFSGTLTLTNGANLVLPSGTNVTTAAGDVFKFTFETGSLWRCTGYALASGRAIVGASGAITSSGLTMATSRLLGRTTASTGAIEELSVSGAVLSAGVLAVQQLQPISASVSSNALTISASALSLDFRSTTLGSGTVTNVQGTPANLVVPSSATLGTVNAVQSNLVVLALNNAGTIELAVVNISGGVDLSEIGVISTTAISAAATSASVIYSTTARTNVAYRVIGVIRSTQTTAGTWATDPSLVQGYGGNALAAMSSLGYGQTYQNVASIRALATTYYNTTGKPIFVAALLNGANAATARVQAIINGTSVMQSSEAAAASNTCAIWFIVPSGCSYSVSNANGSFTSVGQWFELR